VSSTDIKNDRSCTSNPPACLHDVNRDNFPISLAELIVFQNHILYEICISEVVEDDS
jgi:hypothetical protein